MERKVYEILEEQIWIETEIPLLSVQKMEIQHQANAHGTLQIWAEVREEEEEKILYTNWMDTKILVKRKGEEKEPFFSGKVEKLFCKKEDRLFTIEIRGIGATVLFDRERKSQSFQKKEMTYKQVVRQVLKEQESANFIWMVGEDRAIEMPILQYQETDWEFLKRICSHFHGKLFADLKTGKPNFFFGMCAGKKREVEEAEVAGFRFPSTYYEDGCYRDGLSRSQVFCVEVRTKKNWQMGDSIYY